MPDQGPANVRFGEVERRFHLFCFDRLGYTHALFAQCETRTAFRRPTRTWEPLTMLNVALTLLIVAQTPAQITDERMLEMGHAAYMKAVRAAYPDDIGQWVDGEKRFQLQLAYRKEALIQSSPQRDLLNQIDILLANITKSACRAGDAFTVGTPNEFLYNAKASTAMVLSMEAILKNTPTTSVLQPKVWQTYREIQRFHQTEEPRIAEFAQRGGFSVEQHGFTINAIGNFITKVAQLMKDFTRDQKSHLFSLCIRLLRLTTGEDPLPY